MNEELEWDIFEEAQICISDEATDLITRLLVVDPQQRLGYGGVEEVISCM